MSEFELSPLTLIWGCLCGLLTLYILKWFLRGTQCKNDKRLDGQTVIVTGASSGIGLETAKELCRRGARVIMLCRNKSKAMYVKALIMKELAEEQEMNVGQLVVRDLDLANLSSVRDCANKILKEEKQINVLVLNAGVMTTPSIPRTADDFEMQMGTNYLGHFVLTNQLTPLIVPTAGEDRNKNNPARIVIVSSELHRLANSRIRIHDLNWERQKDFSPSQGYFHSKLALVLFGKELARRLDGKNIFVSSLHPGVISDTNLSYYGGTSGDPLANLFYFNHCIFSRVLKTPFEGIQTVLHCCLSDEIKSGSYYKECSEVQPSSYAQHEDDASNLWELSDKLTADSS